MIGFQDPVLNKPYPAGKGVVLKSQTNGQSYCFDLATLVMYLQEHLFHDDPINKIELTVQGSFHTFIIPDYYQHLAKKVRVY